MPNSKAYYRVPCLFWGILRRNPWYNIFFSVMIPGRHKRVLYCWEDIRVESFRDRKPSRFIWWIGNGATKFKYWWNLSWVSVGRKFDEKINRLLRFMKKSTGRLQKDYDFKNSSVCKSTKSLYLVLIKYAVINASFLISSIFKTFRIISLFFLIAN